MKMPWINKTGLAKATLIFATGFLVSLGLCGVNAIFFLTAGDLAGIVPTYTGIIELVTMAVCLIGLVIVGLIGVVQAIYRRSANAPTPPKDS